MDNGTTFALKLKVHEAMSALSPQTRLEILAWICPKCGYFIGRVNRLCTSGKHPKQ